MACMASEISKPRRQLRFAFIDIQRSASNRLLAQRAFQRGSVHHAAVAR